MRKSKPQLIADVVKDVVERLEQAKSQDSYKIFSQWPKIAGKKLAQHTAPASFRGGVLKVLVDDSAWFYQANLQKEALLEQLRKKVKSQDIQGLQFRIGTKDRHA